MIPIYQQIVAQIKELIRKGELVENEQLPSVRSLAKQLRISALTVKKAYDQLEEEGFSKTVHGKGSFILQVDSHVFMEEKLKEVEEDFELAIQKALFYGIELEEIRQIVEIILGEKNAKD